MAGKRKKGKLFIGTSNVVLPGNKSTFPEPFRTGSRLHYYSSLFNTVELNSTFYKVPQSSTFEKWAGEVTGDFVFTIKLWKEITHVKELKFSAADIKMFMLRAKCLGPKKGCLLLQFPGKITIDYYTEVEKILKAIKKFGKGAGWKNAVEFRHASWHIRETLELLDEYKAALVLHDFSKVQNNGFTGNANFIYQRFHGPDGNYRGSYDKGFLSQKATQAKKWLQEGRDVFLYFNNTMGEAFENARQLREMITG